MEIIFWWWLYRIRILPIDFSWNLFSHLHLMYRVIRNVKVVTIWKLIHLWAYHCILEWFHFSGRLKIRIVLKILLMLVKSRVEIQKALFILNLVNIVEIWTVGYWFVGCHEVWMVNFPVYWKFSSLSELVLAPTHITNKRFGSCMCVLMFFQVLRQWESLLTVFADMAFLIQVDQIMSFQRKFTGEELLAVPNIALV